MSLDDLSDKLENASPLKLLRELEGRIIEYAPGKKTKVLKINDDGSFSLEHEEFDQDGFTEYIQNFIQKRMKEELE